MRMRFPVRSVLKVIDGDSIRVVLDRGWRDYSERDIRIQGVDAPERHTDAGKAVTECVTAWVEVPGRLWLSSEELDKFGRVLGNLDRGEPLQMSLSEWLLHYGLVKVYEDRREPWNEEQLATVTANAHKITDEIARGSGSVYALRTKT